MSSKPRKIAVAVTHRTPYGRLKPVLKAIQSHPDLELQIIVATPVFFHDLLFALRHSDFSSIKVSISWYIKARLRKFFGGKSALNELDLLSKSISADGFSISAHVPVFIAGGNLKTMTKSVGAGIINLPVIFEKLKPDVVLIHADRFEMLAVAVAASLMNIPIAHTQGGEVSGTIDEKARHAITKLSHIHFPTTNQSKERLLRMGESADRVFLVGCPTIDVLKRIDLSPDNAIFDRNGNGHGDRLDLSKPYILVLQHPVTTEYGEAKRQMEETLKAVQSLNMPVFLLWPNIDAGSDGASAAVSHFIKHHNLPAFALFKTLHSEDFYKVLKNATVAVGNSSSFIRESSYLGTPTVLIGSRQNNRERADNVIEVSHDHVEIKEAVLKQLAHGPYPSSNLFGDGETSNLIADILSDADIIAQKYFIDY